MGVAVISLEEQDKIRPIMALEKELEQLPQVDLPVCHDFCTGIYARTLVIPAGVCLTGAIHKDESFFVVRSGILIVTTDEGPQQVGPGFMSVTRPHSKRAGMALTDVVCTTFHANTDRVTDPDQLWDMITIPAPESLLETKQ